MIVIPDGLQIKEKAVLGRLPGTTIYRNIQQYPEAYSYNGIVIVRIDAPIYFANISYIKDRLREFEVDRDGAKKRGPEVERVYFVILEMAPVTYIDSSAAQALKDLYHEYKSREIQIAIANPNCEVLLTLAKSGVYDMIGKEWYFVRVHDAVQICLQHAPCGIQRQKTGDLIQENKPSFLHKLQKQRENWTNLELESGEQDPIISLGTKVAANETSERKPSLFDRLLKQAGDETNPESEPLLPGVPCSLGAHSASTLDEFSITRLSFPVFHLSSALLVFSLLPTAIELPVPSYRTTYYKQLYADLTVKRPFFSGSQTQLSVSRDLDRLTLRMASTST
ncbi:Sulfate transporter 4.1 protein, partial [Thalictrum thalictroides]